MGKLEFKNLSKEKQQELRKTYLIINKLVEFSNKANLNLFVFLYGNQIGTHLFSKFREFSDMLKFLNYLDIENRTILLTNIFGSEDEVNLLFLNC